MCRSGTNGEEESRENGLTWDLAEKLSLSSQASLRLELSCHRRLPPYCVVLCTSPGRIEFDVDRTRWCTTRSTLAFFSDIFSRLTGKKP